MLVSRFMKHLSRRIISLLLLFATITGLLGSFGEIAHCAWEPADAHRMVHLPIVGDMTQIHDDNCPCFPSPSNSHDHFCTGDCGCPCQAPLAPAPMAFSYSPAYTSLFPAEINRHIPVVYLSLFVPPDSATI